MNSAKIRKLLQSSDPYDMSTTNDPTFNVSTTTTHLTPTTTTFDASMALTILVLLTALFFMGFFSAYIRRFSENHSNTNPPTSTSSTTPHNRKGGLESNIINSLPIIPYGKAASAAAAVKHRMIIDDCAICLSEFDETENVKLIPYCGHVFHPSCVDTWLGSHVTCPLCRSAQLFERCDDEDEEVCLNVTRDKDGTEVGEGSNGGNAHQAV